MAKSKARNLTADEKMELEHWLESAQDAFWRVLWRLARRRGYAGGMTKEAFREAVSGVVFASAKTSTMAKKVGDAIKSV